MPATEAVGAAVRATGSRPLRARDDDKREGLLLFRLGEKSRSRASPLLLAARKGKRYIGLSEDPQSSGLEGHRSVPRKEKRRMQQQSSSERRGVLWSREADEEHAVLGRNPDCKQGAPQPRGE